MSLPAFKEKVLDGIPLRGFDFQGIGKVFPEKVYYLQHPLLLAPSAPVKFLCQFYYLRGNVLRNAQVNRIRRIPRLF